METRKQNYINPDSDGRFYGLNDMVKVNCQDCAGCSKCCRGMGDSIVLDPFDIYQFQKNAGKTAEQLLAAGEIELGVVQGMVLPHLKMQESSDACAFLNQSGRCEIHAYRPGMCRLFPLGRDFSEGELRYILLNRLCENKNRTKEKVSRWLGLEAAKKYHDFVLLWHTFRREMTRLLSKAEEEQQKILNLYLVKTFFLQAYDTDREFYPQIEEKIEKYRKLFLEA